MKNVNHDFDLDLELEQIRKARDAILDHFWNYVIDCKLNWPICWHDGEEMIRVFQKGNVYYRCFRCGHCEWNI